jgi:nucleoid-associated protein YgaU
VEVPMRLVPLLTAITATLALVVAPMAAAQSADTKTQQPKATAPAAKPAPKAAAAAADKAQKVEGAAAVRSSPADLKRSGSEKSYDGCGSSKMSASDA